MFADRSLLRILGAQGLSSLGTSVSTVALAVMVFDRTGSVLHMGGILAAGALPLVLMSFLGGALLDRFEGKRLMVVADLARAGLMLLMPLAATRSVGLVYVVAAAIGIFASVFNPSQVKVVGEIVPKAGLVKANSYLSIAGEGAQLGGYVLGGALVAGVGYGATFVLDAASYLISAALLIGLPAVVPRAGGARVSQLMRESPRVLSTIWQALSLRTNLLLACVPMLVVMTGTPNAYGLALDVFKRGPGGFALMETVTSIGWLLGGVLASRVAYRGDRNLYVTLSMLFMAVCYIGVGFAGTFWLAVLLLTCTAMANVGVIVGSMTLFQEIPPRPDKGRIIALRAGFGQMASTVGLLVGGALGQALGEQRVFVAAGLVTIILCASVFLPYWVGMRRDPGRREAFLHETPSIVESGDAA